LHVWKKVIGNRLHVPVRHSIAIAYRQIQYCCLGLGRGINGSLGFVRLYYRFREAMHGDLSEKGAQFMAGLIESTCWGKRLARGPKILLFDVVDDVAGYVMKTGMQFAGLRVVLWRQHPARLRPKPLAKFASFSVAYRRQIQAPLAAQKIPEPGFPGTMYVNGIFDVAFDTHAPSAECCYTVQKITASRG
jgi:hypothetical protein